MTADFDRGINLAGVLDRRDDRPGWSVRPRHLAAIASAGFTAVGVPVRRSGSPHPSPTRRARTDFGAYDRDRCMPARGMGGCA